jgi:hypothetical protein
VWVLETNPVTGNDAMLSFIQRHAAKVRGILHGFDRVRLRGTLRWLANCRGLLTYLFAKKVLLKEFKEYATDITDRIRTASHKTAEAAGRPLEYLHSSALSKEDRARAIAQADGVTEGLIAVFSCVEPCISYRIARNRDEQKLELRCEHMKCLHHYFYYLDPQLGFCHLRLQTWFPFNLHVCLNGREWLARQMDQAGLGYVRRDNTFTHVADLEQAQQLFDQQLKGNWEVFLRRLTQQSHPLHRELFRDPELTYYWSIDESEWASDVMFRTSDDLAALYPRLIRHGLTGLGSPDVLRFLGRKTTAQGEVNAHFAGEIATDLKRRPEGMRIKHRLNRNSIKMYDKQGSVLRVETTINDARDLKVYRRSEGDPNGPKKWLRMRKGVADLRRRAQISQASNQRYLASLATVDSDASLGELSAPLCQPAQLAQRRVRALNPLSVEDGGLLASVSRGEFAINGFRNRDLRALLSPADEADPATLRRRSAAITRKLRLLRGHGLISKVAKTHRYVLTNQGREAIAALLAAKNASATKLNQLAA